MKRDFNAIGQGRFDLAVVGGGVIGTGIARDAALRGIKTLLLEREDYGYGTTSRSTRLIHGGLRYLSHFDFKLVRQDLRERETLLKIAPHLVKPLAFLLPLTSVSQRLVMAAGMQMYDRLSYDKSVPSYRHFSPQETLRLEPSLEIRGLRGSYEFHDCQVQFPERLCVENALSAAEAGAVMLNHTEVVGMEKANGAVTTVRVKDALTKETKAVSARLIVNVAGHWANGILKMVIDHPQNEVRTTMGIHLVTRKISNHAFVLFAKSDGRLIFAIPWQDYSLIGTTDTPYSGDPDFLHASAEDVAYLVRETRQAFPSLSASDICYTFAGLRSLIGSAGQKVSNISRSHKLVDHETTDGLKGLISVLGGKMTGYRSIAEEAVDLVCVKLGINARCTTGETPLPGAPARSGEAIEKTAPGNQLSPDIVTHLNDVYGSRCSRVLQAAQEDPRGKQPLCSHSKDILAQVWQAVNEESALTVSDFLLRRGTVGLASCQGLDSVEVVALEMGRMLGWSIGTWQEQARDYRFTAGLQTQFKQHMGADT